MTRAGDSTVVMKCVDCGMLTSRVLIEDNGSFKLRCLCFEGFSGEGEAE